MIKVTFGRITKETTMMYLIAICDDEKKELDKTERMLDAYQRDHPGCVFSIERFENAQELLYMVREQGYAPDLILLDIYMPQKTGMHAAQELRDMGSGGRIIFITTSSDHALEAFGVDASQYLVKPVAERQLFSILDKYFSEIEEQSKRYLLLRVDGRIRRIALEQILSCEAQGKRQCLYLQDGSQVIVRMTIAELYKMLEPYEEFVRVGASYIVNLAHVDSLNSREICLDNGRSIYPPRGAYQPLRERYFHYYCAGGGTEQPEVSTTILSLEK